MYLKFIVINWVLSFFASYYFWDLNLVESKNVFQQPNAKLKVLLNDMILPHDAKLSGVPSTYDWHLKPRINYGNKPPDGWTAMLPWGQIYKDSKPIQAKNTRIQIRNLQAWYLDSMNVWHLWGSTSDLFGKYFEEDYKNDKSYDTELRTEKTGGISIKLTEGFNFHFWRRQGRYNINPQNIKGVYISAESRLIVEDKKKKDDRNLANFLMGVGGDYWKDEKAVWDNYKTNGDIAIGRLKYIKRNWQKFNLHTLSETTLLRFPPPIK